MENMLEKLTPAPDKLKHFFWGFVIHLIALVVLKDPLKALGAVTAAGVVIELRQKLWKKGTPSLMDLVFTVLPSVLLLLTNKIN